MKVGCLPLIVLLVLTVGPTLLRAVDAPAPRPEIERAVLSVLSLAVCVDLATGISTKSF